MKSTVLRLLRRNAFAALVVACVLVAFQGALAQELSHAINAQDQAAVRAVAASLGSVPDRADAILTAMGFSFGQTIPGFADWPALRKFETAYLSAVAAGGPNEGVRFLRRASRTVAVEQTNAIRYEKALAAYFPEASSAPITVGDSALILFAATPASAAPVEPQVQAAILAMERYVERVPGGLQSVMAICCGHGQADIYDMLRRAPTRADALTTAIQTGKMPPQLRERLLLAIQTIAENTHAAAGALDPIKVDLQARQDEQARITGLLRNAGGTGGGGGGGAKSGFDANMDRYRRAQAQVGERPLYRPPATGSRPAGTRAVPLSGGGFSFGAMRASGGGFGGVVFGAKVVGGPQTGKPVGLIWTSELVDDAVREWGHYDIVFADGSVGMTRRLRAEDAYSALEIVNGRSGVFPALDLRGGEGVGLASVARSETATVDTALDSEAFLLHPALFGFRLGDAAVLADATGFMMPADKLVEHLKQSGAPQPVQIKARTWIEGEHGFYKITDVSSQVVRRSGLVRVERIADVSFAATLRRSALLSFQAFKGRESEAVPLPESATPFYEIVPALTKGFPQFDRLNDFAETFALVRWASLNGARVMAPGEPPRGPARTVVLVTSSDELAQVSEDDAIIAVAVEEIATATHRDNRMSGILQKAGVDSDIAAHSRQLMSDVADRYRLQAAIRQARITSAPAVESSLEGRVKAIDDKLRTLRDQRRAAAAVATATDARALNALIDRIRAATSAVNKVEDRVAELEDSLPSDNERIAGLPAAQRPAAKRLLDLIEGTRFDALMADSEAASNAATSRAERNRAALETLLPPVDTRQLDAAKAELTTRERECQSAEATFEKELQSRMPWFNDWYAASLFGRSF